MSINNLNHPAPATQINSQRLLFLDAFGGSGKEFVKKVIQCLLKSKGRSVLAVVSSAVAAQLSDGRCTAHSALTNPVSMNPESTTNTKTESRPAHELCVT